MGYRRQPIKLSEPGRTEVRELLFEYARSRLVAPGSIKTYEEVQDVVKRSVVIQSKLWPATKSALRQAGEMSDPEKALLVTALNNVLDAHTSRMAVFYDRLPMAVLVLLVLSGGASLAVAAYKFQSERSSMPLAYDHVCRHPSQPCR